MTTVNGKVCGALMVALSLWLVSTQPAAAGGSVAFEDVRHQIPEPVLKHLESSYTIEPNGDATRLGRHYSELGGSRVGPYHFRAVAKKNANLVFELTLKTDVTFLDTAGKATDDPEAATSVREMLLSCDLVLNLASADTTTPPPLTDAEREQVVDALRENSRVAEDIIKENEWPEREAFLVEGDQFKFVFRRGVTRQGVVRKIYFQFSAEGENRYRIETAGDESLYTIEIEFDEKARPSFV